MTPIRPDLALLWPSYTFFPLAALGVLVFGAAGGDPVMVVIGLGLLAVNIGIVVNQAYFTTLAIAGDELVFRTNFGLTEERVPIGALQRIDAKRYPGAHSGVSAPFFVARGRASTVKVNTKPYRLASFMPLLAALRQANARIELDPFWERVAQGQDVSKEIALTPRSRW
ncbi:MAG TPA: hypothetical protein VFM06_12315 [Candidatus Limnocylindria bacterium]|nr:hypothetical protein [Candidatus Limnocylindria bacterium]